MPVPSAIGDLSTTAASNSPAGSESLSGSNGPDDYLRALSAFIATLRDRKISDFAAIDSSELAGKVNDETGSGALVFATSPTLVTPALGEPASGTLTNCTIPVGGVSGLGTGVAAWLADPTSAKLATAITDEIGTAGSLVFSAGPTFTGTVVLPSTTSIGSVTNTEIGYLAGVTSAIQTQLAGLGGPAFSVYNASDMAGAGTSQKVVLDTEVFDTDNYFDNEASAGNGYRFKPLVAGYYQINAQITYKSPGSNGMMKASIYKNGSAYSTTQFLSNDNANSLNCSTVVSLNGSTDYIELFVEHTQSSRNTTTGGATLTCMSGHRVRGL